MPSGLVATAEYQVRFLDRNSRKCRATDEFLLPEQLLITSVQKRTPRRLYKIRQRECMKTLRMYSRTTSENEVAGRLSSLVSSVGGQPGRSG
jgi:hypothetical protein